MKNNYASILLFLLFFATVFTMNGAVLKTASQTSGITIEETQIGLDYITTEEFNNSELTNSTTLQTSTVDITTEELPATVATSKISSVYVDGFWQGLFYGVLLLLILINTVCFILFDEKIYLMYGSSLSALAAFLFYSDGLFAFFDMNNLQNTEAVKASFFLVAAIASVVFGSRFLRLNTLYPKLKYIATGVFTAALITLIAGWFLDTAILAAISNVLSMIVVLSYFIAGVLLFSQKTYAKMYVFAMAFSLLFTVDYLFAEPFNFSFLQVDIAHIKGAVLFQISLLTYGILYRMKEIKEENIIKQTELKIFLKNQEMTARQKTEKHIEDEYLENVIMQYDLDLFEIKLLQYISVGKSNEKIARKLNVTDHELEVATNELYQKLEIRERIKADQHLVVTQPDFIYN